MQTQFKKRTHRAKNKLDSTPSHFKWAFDAAKSLRLEIDEIPTHVFVPSDQFFQFSVNELNQVGLANELQGFSESEQITIISSGMLWSAWRMTQGIFRFDDEIYKAVIQTDPPKKVPIHVLRELPHWCVYIETPGLICDFGAGKTDLFGFWAMFSYSSERELLMIFGDVDGDNYDPQMPPTIHIDTQYNDIESALTVVLGENKIIDKDQVESYSSWLYPVLNLLVYLCSYDDIHHKNQTEMPQNPQPKKTKKGPKLFPAQGVKTWDVGVRMGAAIRKAEQKAYESQGESVGSKRRPHVRNAHWHTFLSGKRKDKDGNLIEASKRKREVRWMPPQFINIDDDDIQSTAVVRVVK